MNETLAQTLPSAAPGSPPRQFTSKVFWRWFWLSTIPVSLAWLWYDFYVPSNQITWAKDFASAQQLANTANKPIIVFFTGKWCVPCHIMERKVLADQQVETSIQAAFIPLLIDVADPHAAETVSHYQVFGTPTTIILDPHGNILKRVEGGMDKPAFLELIGKLPPATAAHAP